MTETFYFQPEVLENTVYDLCRASGSPEDEARLVAERLIKADLTGHPSHGAIRITMYVRMVRSEMIKPGAKPELIVDNGSTALVDGKFGYGQVGAEKAMQICIEKGLEHGVTAVGVTNLSHIGRLADYAISAANNGLVALIFTAMGGVAPIVAPFDGYFRQLGTNPFAVAFPRADASPIVLDMATSVMAEGKLRVMKDSGKPVPDNVIVDKDGNPTNNAEDFYAGGALLPLGGKQGHKGYLLAVMVEILGGLMTGGGFIGSGVQRPFNNCSMMIGLDVSKFRQIPVFNEEMEQMIKFLKDSPVGDGKEVLYPGEIEERSEKEKLRTGIPLAAKTVETIQEELDEYKIDYKLAEKGSPTPLG